jgi:hypothetical protein
VFIRRILVAVSAALMISILPTALVSSWTSDCSSTGGKWCIYRDDNHALPVAAMNGNLDNYNNGAKYPNTDTLINDSANGSANWYPSNAVNSYKAAYQQQYDRCTGELGGWWTIGFFNNDTWSSHLIVSPNAC